MPTENKDYKRKSRKNKRQKHKNFRVRHLTINYSIQNKVIAK